MGILGIFKLGGFIERFFADSLDILSFLLSFLSD